MAKLAIKSDNRKQKLLLPPLLDELVPEAGSTGKCKISDLFEELGFRV